MHIVLDARTVYTAGRRGTGKNLIDLYRHIARQRPDWRVTALHRPFEGEDPFANVPGFTHRAIDIRGDRWGLWTHLRLPLAARATGDLLHCPANTGPRRPGRPMVVTIHDLIPLEPQSGHPDPARWERAVGQAARTARRIMTPSSYSKTQIVARFGIPEDRVHVNHWAPAEGCRRVSDPDQLARVRQSCGLDADSPYVVGFGGEDPRKNTRGILQAWAGLAPALREAHRLVLIGIRPSVRAGLEDWARQLGVAGSCVLAGYVPEPDMAPLLSGATALCYASRSEGFGLPVLDGFICGTAVLTSDTTSLPEVAGDAAVYVDPNNPDDIADKLQQLLTDAGLRRELVARGTERVRAFTWDACAARAIRIFEQALGTSS